MAISTPHDRGVSPDRMYKFDTQHCVLSFITTLSESNKTINLPGYVCVWLAVSKVEANRGYVLMARFEMEAQCR
jgi:hypothetical protein